MKSSFAFRFCTDSRHAYIVVLHTTEKPDSASWDEYVEVLAATKKQRKNPVRIFAISDGGGPDSGQRRVLAAAFTGVSPESVTHVFTTSNVTRGIVTAFDWVARSRAVAYAPEAFCSVCEQCQVPVRAVLDDLLELQKELPPVKLLEQIVRCGNGRQ